MNIIITGASRGIGEALAYKFAEMPNYSHIYLISRNKKKLEKIKLAILNISTEINVTCLPFDLSDLKKNTNLLTDQISCKHIDIVINNAGYLVNKPIEALSSLDIQQTLDVNFTGPVLLIQALMLKMGGERSSHIVNIGSMGGFQGSSKFPGLSVYSASKAAIASFTECMAVEFAHTNIFTNCLALGAVQTEMLGEAFPGFKAPVSPSDMAGYISDFALNGHKFFNGKVLPVALTDPE